MEHFNPQKDVRFLTLRGKMIARHQTIGWAADTCKKLGKTYFVVREENKQQKGYHFHAIVQVDKEPTKSFYKKGIHTHLTKVGRPDDTKGMVIPPPGVTAKDVHEAKGYATLDEKYEIDTYYAIEVFERKMKRERKKYLRSKNLERVVGYVKKDFNKYGVAPKQYEDYVLVVNGSNRPLTVP